MYPNDEGRAEAITWNNLRDIIRAYTAISHLSNGRAFERDIFVALLLSVIKNKFRQTVRRKRFLEFWRLTKHQARTTHTRRIVAIQIYVSFRPFRRSSRAVSDQFLVWKKAVSLRENKNLSRVFSRVLFSFFDTFVFCIASLFLHKSSSFFFESVTREEQNPIRTPWSR